MTFTTFIITLFLTLTQTISTQSNLSQTYSSGNITECIEEYCKPQAVKCFADIVCSAGITCVSECTTDICATDCINSHMNLAMISLGSCANSHNCLSFLNSSKH